MLHVSFLSNGLTMGLVRLCLLLLPLVAVHAGWDNDWDSPLHFQCDQNIDGISSIVSEHNNYKEDRRFEFECSTVTTKSHSAKCYWTHYVNLFDELVHFSCPHNYYINGMSSFHNNHYEDRRWKFRCCEAPGLKLEACYFSGWTNGWDRPQNFRIYHGTILKGVVSVHDNKKEDRRFDYLICKAEGETEDGWIDGRSDDERMAVAEMDELEAERKEAELSDVIDETKPRNQLLDILSGRDSSESFERSEETMFYD